MEPNLDATAAPAVRTYLLETIKNLRALATEQQKKIQSIDASADVTAGNAVIEEAAEAEKMLDSCQSIMVVPHPVHVAMAPPNPYSDEIDDYDPDDQPADEEEPEPEDEEEQVAAAPSKYSYKPKPYGSASYKPPPSQDDKDLQDAIAASLEEAELMSAAADEPAPETPCPICGNMVKEQFIHSHIDRCLEKQAQVNAEMEKFRWECVFCSFRNDPGLKRCSMCNGEAPAGAGDVEKKTAEPSSAPSASAASQATAAAAATSTPVLQSSKAEEKVEKQSEPASAPDVSCVACSQKHPASIIKSLSLCGHSFCPKCLKSYVEPLLCGDALKLSCSVKGCTHSLSPLDLHLVVSEQTAATYWNRVFESLHAAYPVSWVAPPVIVSAKTVQCKCKKSVDVADATTVQKRISDSLSSATSSGVKKLDAVLQAIADACAPSCVCGQKCCVGGCGGVHKDPADLCSSGKLIATSWLLGSLNDMFDKVSGKSESKVAPSPVKKEVESSPSSEKKLKKEETFAAASLESPPVASLAPLGKNELFAVLSGGIEVTVSSDPVSAASSATESTSATASAIASTASASASTAVSTSSLFSAPAPPPVPGAFGQFSFASPSVPLSYPASMGYPSSMAYPPPVLGQSPFMASSMPYPPYGMPHYPLPHHLGGFSSYLNAASTAASSSSGSPVSVPESKALYLPKALAKASGSSALPSGSPFGGLPVPQSSGIMSPVVLPVYDPSLAASAAVLGTKKKTKAPKGIGYEGNDSVKYKSTVRAKAKAQNEQDECVAALLECLRIMLGDRSFTGEFGLECYALLFKSTLNALLAFYLRNDSLTDQSRRSAIYYPVYHVCRTLGVNDDFLPLLRPDGSSMDPAIGSHVSLSKMLTATRKQAALFLSKPGALLENMDQDSLTVVSLAADIKDVGEIIESHTSKHLGRLAAFAACLDQGSTQAADDDEKKVSNTDVVIENFLRNTKFDTVDIINCPIQHIDIASVNAPNSGFAARGRLMRLRQEIASLSSDLPDGIFVRADSNRFDVLRAVIIGPKDTPYENGIFAFDIFLPGDYPNQPPHCTFTTTNHGTFRFNPNLYSNGRSLSHADICVRASFVLLNVACLSGKVCLSLLGTWSGPGWDPKISTLLQVLVSIQSMILCDEPYYNEPGWASVRGTPQEFLARIYENKLRHGTLMIAIVDALKNPPPGFEDVVRAHFWLKREEMLKQIDRWTEMDANAVKLAAEKKATGQYQGGQFGEQKVSTPFAEVAASARAAISGLTPPTVSV